MGGAIAARRTLFDIKNSVFDGNTATSSGGAIYLDISNYTNGNNLGLVSNITDSTFTSNKASYGGAIYSSSNIAGNKLFLNNVTFGSADDTTKANTVSGSGGAIYASNTIFNIKDSKFYGNTANYGGAIYSTLSSYTGANGLGDVSSISNTIFQKNATSKYYGGLYT